MTAKLWHRRAAAGGVIAVAALIGASLPATSAFAASQNFWVDPAQGSDSNSGTSSATAFKTLTKAQSAVRAVDGSMSGDIAVTLRGGTYSPASTLALSAADSGTNGYSVRWQAAPGETPIISGARPITGWTTAGNGLYKAAAGSTDFRQLYVNGVRATRARFPDVGSWFQISGFSTSANTITVPAASLGSWSATPGLEMVLETQWGENYLRVKNVSGTTVTFQDAESNILFPRPAPAVESGQVFHWEGEAAFISQPGEWYLDKAASTVYYRPRAGEDMSTAVVTAPSLQTLVDISGTSASAPAARIAFSGVTFTGTTWLYPSTNGYLNGQGGMYNLTANAQNQQTVGRPPAAVHVANATNISFTSDSFTGVGATALDLDHGTLNSSVTGNVFNGMSGNAITMGKFSDPNVEYHSLYNPPATPSGSDIRDVAKGNTVSNNLITRFGLDYYGTAGINLGWTNSSTVTHNDISDGPWAGITVGWGWQSNAGAAANNSVQYNEVSDVMTILCDSGGIYHLSVDPNSSYSNNYVHDVLRTPGSCPNPIEGLYLDEGSDQLTAANNVLSDVADPLFQNKNGPNVTLSNNSSSNTSVIQAAGLEPAYGKLRAAVDVVQGKVTSASSSYSSTFSPSQAADGNSATGWSPTAADTNAWWQVDLGKPTSLDQVQVVTRQDLDQAAARTGFQVEGSNDASFTSYTTLGRLGGWSIPNAGSASFKVQTTAAFRYLRVQKTDGQYFYLADVRATAAEGETSPTPSTPTLKTGSYYQLINQNSGLAADVSGSSTADGAPIQQSTSTSSMSQQWQIKPEGGGLYQIINRASGKLLDVAGSSMQKGATVDQWPSAGGNNQLWYFEAGPSGTYVIRNLQSRQVLDVSGGSTATGAAVDQWGPFNSSNQYWTLTPAA